MHKLKPYLPIMIAYAILNFFISAISDSMVITFSLNLMPEPILLDQLYLLVIFLSVCSFDIIIPDKVSCEYKIWIILGVSFIFYYPLSMLYSLVYIDYFLEGFTQNSSISKGLLLRFYILGIIFSFILSLKIIPEKSPQATESKIEA